MSQQNRAKQFKLAREYRKVSLLSISKNVEGMTIEQLRQFEKVATNKNILIGIDEEKLKAAMEYLNFPFRFLDRPSPQLNNRFKLKE